MAGMARGLGLSPSGFLCVLKYCRDLERKALGTGFQADLAQ